MTKKDSSGTSLTAVVGVSVSASDAAPHAASELGLNVDMLDVDRLRDWARLIEVHGDYISDWGDPAFVIAKLRDIADGLADEVRDVGTLRAINHDLLNALKALVTLHSDPLGGVLYMSARRHAREAIAKAEGKPR